MHPVYLLNYMQTNFTYDFRLMNTVAHSSVFAWNILLSEQILAQETNIVLFHTIYIYIYIALQ